MYRVLQLILDGTPTTLPRKKKKQGEEEKKIQENNDISIISISFRSGFGKKNWFPKLTSLWLLSLLKNANWSSKKGPPPQIATFNYQGSQCINKCMIFIHILCIGFCSWYLMAPQPHFQGKRKNKGRKRRRYKKTMIYQLYQYLLDPGLVKKIGFPNWPVCDYFLY